MNAEQIVEVFENIARLLELKGENPFKIRAYTHAARALETLHEPLEPFHVERVGSDERSHEWRHDAPEPRHRRRPSIFRPLTCHRTRNHSHDASLSE